MRQRRRLRRNPGPRDYGYGDSTPLVRGRPYVVARPRGGDRLGPAAQATISGAPPPPPLRCPHHCPTCGGLPSGDAEGGTIFLVEVTMELRQLRGGVGKARYFGCAACPWASPTLVIATPVRD